MRSRKAGAGDSVPGRLRRRTERYRAFSGGHGRHCQSLTRLQCRAIALLLERRPRLGVPALRHEVPALPRNALAAYVRRWRRVQRRRRRRRLRKTLWTVAGAVWAIDGTWFDQAIESGSRRAFVVVELQSRDVLAVRAVAGERAAAAIAVLEELVRRHGAPLVLKLDNGSAFLAKRFRDFCRRHGITLLYSPVRRPSYNGSCEVSGRWAKHRAMVAAAGRGDGAQLRQEDLDHAVTYVGVMPKVCPLLRQHFHLVLAEQRALVVAERGLVRDARLADHVARSLERVAVRRTLLLCHILTIEDRGYRQCLPASAA